MNKNPRCATPAIDWIMANWKQEASPYDDPAYEVPTCQREKIIPDTPMKQIRCATPALDELLRLEADYDQRIITSESETDNVKSLQDRRS